MAARRTAADQPRDISKHLQVIRKRHALPGIVGAIVQGNRIAAIGCDGVRQVGESQPITINDRMHLGSCTKAMTATMIARLVERDVLSWKTTVGEVFGKRVPTMDAQWRDVTLEQLLTNRSGAPPDLDADGLWGKLWAHKGSPQQARMLLVEGVLRRPPACTPGTRFIYSNASFSIAGAMAETVTGTSWEQLMRTELFEPLGITTAGFGAPGTPDKLDQPRGHRKDGSHVPPGRGADNPVAIGPAGIVHCSIEDWAKFVSLHMEAAQGSCRLLKPESFAKLQTPWPSDDGQHYAMGWGVTTRPWAKGDSGIHAKRTGRVLTHAGSNTMWYCVVWIAPERNFAVLIACNQGGDAAAKACDEAVAALIQDHIATIAN